MWPLGAQRTRGGRRTYPNQKLWTDGGSRAKLKACSTAFNHGKRSGSMSEYKQRSYSLRKAIKHAKRQYSDKVNCDKFNGSDTGRMWQGLQEITDYKKKSSHVTDTNVTLPDKLNTFFACFENNTVPLSWPDNKDCAHPSPSPWLM